MKKQLIILLITVFISRYNTYSQESVSVDKWKEYIEELAEESANENQLEALYTELSYLSEHPMDLNQVTAEELSRLPFLTDRQIEQLIAYRKRYGEMVSIYELKGVNGLDYQTIQLLLPFVYVGEKTVNKQSFTVKNLLKYGKNELQIRYDRCLQQKKGYGSYPDSVLARAYEFEDYLQAGLVAEKDAGEPFWTEKHKGYDYYSFHALIKEQGVLKTLVLGDYKVSFGQGLVISNDFSPSRSALVAQA